MRITPSPSARQSRVSCAAYLLFLAWGAGDMRLQAGEVLGFELLSSNRARINISRAPSQSYTLLTTTNLLIWNPVVLGAPEVSSETSVTHDFNLMPGWPQAYYRVLYQELPDGPEPIEVLDGPPAGAVTDYLPDMGVPLVDESEVEFFKGALPISLAHVLATVLETATVEALNDVLASENISLAGSVPTMNLVILRRNEVTNLEDLYDLIARLRLTGLFSTVTDDFGMSAPEKVEPPVPIASLIGPQDSSINWTWEETGLGYGRTGNNHFEMSRVPQLWNWLDYAHRQKEFLGGHDVAVLEFAFYDHEDLDDNVVLGYTQSTGVEADDYSHGVGVMGVIAARHDGQGIQGVTPLPDRVVGHAFPVNNTSAHVYAGAYLGQLASIVGAVPPPKVINISSGMKWITENVGHPTNVVLTSGETGAEWMDRHGKLWADCFQSVNQHVSDPNYLVVCAAGNELGLDARWASPMANIACRPNYLGTRAPQFFTVESVSGMRQTSSFSDYDYSRMGDVASAGGEIVTILQGPGFEDFDVLGSGTSFSAPLVSGVASFLWNLEPSLTTAEMKSLLRDPVTTFVVQGGQRANLVDAYSAALAIDGLRGYQDVHTALVDVDDGTLDGNLRMKAFDYEAEPDEIHTYDGRRGDGLVNMKDFRAFRDAWLHVAGHTNHLDGPPTHFKRDINFDGLIGTQAVSPPHPEPYSKGPVDNPTSLPERTYSRYDFNGNGLLDLENNEYKPPTNAVAPFKLEPDTAITGRDKGLGLLKDLDVIVHPAVWSLDDENMALSGDEPDLNSYSMLPPEDWSTNVLYDFTFYSSQMPYLWSFDLHVDMEGGNAANGGTLPDEYVGELVMDGLWIESFFRTSKARLSEWKGVVTIPFVDPMDIVGQSSPTNFPWVSIYYKKTQGNEFHQYRLHFRPEAGEDIALSVGWDKLAIRSTSREHIVGLGDYGDLPSQEVLVRDPAAGAYGEFFVPWTRFTNRVDNIINPARQFAIGALADRLRMPVALDASPELEPVFEEESDDIGVTVKVYGLEAIFRP